MSSKLYSSHLHVEILAYKRFPNRIEAHIQSISKPLASYHEAELLAVQFSSAMGAQNVTREDKGYWHLLTEDGKHFGIVFKSCAPEECGQTAGDSDQEAMALIKAARENPAHQHLAVPSGKQTRQACVWGSCKRSEALVGSLT